MAAERTIAVPAAPVVLTLAERELVRFFRQRNRVIGALVQPVMFWGLFSAGAARQQLGLRVFLSRHDCHDFVVHGDFCHDLDYRRSPRGVHAVGACLACSTVGDGAGQDRRRGGHCVAASTVVSRARLFDASACRAQ